MKILAVIPARFGSKGIPNKNIKLLNGKPLISYTIEASINSQISHTIVSTDSFEISKIAREYGLEVHNRCASLAKDDTPTLPVIQEVIDNLNDKYDAVMTLQPTSPLRSNLHINEAINLFHDNKSADSLVSVVATPHNYLSEKQMLINGDFIFGNTNPLRRQECKTSYSRNGAAIYLSQMELLKTSILGFKILPYIMDKIHSIDIDDMEDWLIAESILSFKDKINTKLKIL